MTQQVGGHDSHVLWLEDIEYRTREREVGDSAALVRARELVNMTQSALAQAFPGIVERGGSRIRTIGNIRLFAACG